jgi:putative endonuclease
MATVYILYSNGANSYYIGSCNDLNERLEQHRKKKFAGFTSKENDWELVYTLNELNFKQARKIESHIKRMKSRKYIQDLVQFPEITERLMLKYS